MSADAWTALFIAGQDQPTPTVVALRLEHVSGAVLLVETAESFYGRSPGGTRCRPIPAHRVGFSKAPRGDSCPPHATIRNAEHLRQSAGQNRTPDVVAGLACLWLCPSACGRAEHGRVADHPERWRSPFTQAEMREMWTYSDGALTAKGYRWPGGTAGAGSWALVDQATGNVQSAVRAGEFSHRFRPVDVFADVPGLPGYLGTVTAPDGTALVDLVLDRNPFMLANGPRRAARPHALMVPRSHRDGWSSATAAELAACQTAMTLVAAWYRSLDGGHVVFCANDSAPNLDYLRDVEAASRTWPAAAPRPRPPGIPGRTCSTPTCTPSMPNRARR